jgi:predicted Zn finger-like uncharacterized protein
MSRVVECPSCHAHADVQEDLIGLKIRCSRCSAVFLATPLDSWDRPRDPPLSLAPSPAQPQSPRRVGFGTLLLYWLPGGVALLIALAALLVALFRGPGWGGFSNYDFTTPKAALTSEWEIRLNGDLAALVELHRQIDGPRLKEQLRSLDVRKEATWGKKTILFISFEQDGVKKYDTVGFQKDAKTGLWRHDFVSEFEVERENRPLAEQMRSWRESGKLDPGPPGGGPPGGVPDNKKW